MKRKLVLILLNFIFFFSCEKPVPFPEELSGTWVTDAADYQDRFIEIKDMQLIFGAGAELPSVLLINKIKKKETDKGVEWTFYCENIEGNTIDIILLYKTGTNGEQFTLKNKEQVLWTRAQ